MINLDETDSIAICGDRNSGKTNLGFHLLNNYNGERKTYIYGYPKPHRKHTLISEWGELLRLENAIIFIDELNRYVKLYDRKANTELMELLSFISHQKNTLIFTTQLSQFITKGVEASIQTWLIKQLDVQSLKNGCKIKRILQNTAHPRIMANRAMHLKENEYIAYDTKMPVGFNGLHTFPFQNVGKDWRGIIPKETPQKAAKGLPP